MNSPAPQASLETRVNLHAPPGESRSACRAGTRPWGWGQGPPLQEQRGSLHCSAPKKPRASSRGSHTPELRGAARLEPGDVLLRGSVAALIKPPLPSLDRASLADHSPHIWSQPAAAGATVPCNSGKLEAWVHFPSPLVCTAGAVCPAPAVNHSCGVVLPGTPVRR